MHEDEPLAVFVGSGFVEARCCISHMDSGFRVRVVRG